LGTAGAVDAAQLLGLQLPGFQVDEESEDVGVDGACLALLVENVQRGVATGLIERGRLLPESERLIVDFQQRIRGSLA